MEKSAKGSKNRRIGVLGGSFDPVHSAHIALAEAARRQLGLDEIIFMPARQAALKPSAACASPEQRKKMLEIALESADFPHSISDIEMRRQGISYSIDTVRELLALRPDSEIYWIIGSDHLPKLSKWKDIAEFCKLAKFACARRGGVSADFSDAPDFARIAPVDFRPVELSSTRLRNALKSGAAGDLGLDPKVLEYILKNKLYA